MLQSWYLSIEIFNKSTQTNYRDSIHNRISTIMIAIFSLYVARLIYISSHKPGDIPVFLRSIHCVEEANLKQLIRKINWKENL